MASESLTFWLKKLEGLDPALCQAIYEAGFQDCHWPDSLVQWMLQDAIKARGWAYQVSCAWPLGTSFGHIVIVRDNEVVRHLEIPGDNPAETLLRVYLKALEVV